MTDLNLVGESYAHSMIAAGKVDKTSGWSFDDATDGAKLLGKDNADWATYGQMHLGLDRASKDNTKGRYRYPIGKDGKVFRSGVIAAKQRAAAQHDAPIEKSADALLSMMDMPKAAAMGHIATNAEFKFANDAAPGSFEGYASVAGIPDGGGDIVKAGAFTDYLGELKSSGRQLPMYMMHGRRLGADPRPVGVWDSIGEDNKGLKVSGHLVGLDTETGKYNHALVKEGAMRGLSIGYKTLVAGLVRSANNVFREIKKANLFEISIVDDPMNAQARMFSVKAAEQIKTIREFENFLRDEGGYSHAAARAIAERGFKSSEPRDEDGAIHDLLRTLVSVRKSLVKTSS